MRRGVTTEPSAHREQQKGADMCAEPLDPKPPWSSRSDNAQPAGQAAERTIAASSSIRVNAERRPESRPACREDSCDKPISTSQRSISPNDQSLSGQAFSREPVAHPWQPLIIPYPTSPILAEGDASSSIANRYLNYPSDGQPCAASQPELRPEIPPDTRTLPIRATREG
jgi:hypothetical protein